jgi:hypothetical protein
MYYHHKLFWELDPIVRGSSAPKTPLLLNNCFLHLCAFVSKIILLAFMLSFNTTFTDKSTPTHPITSPKHSNQLRCESNNNAIFLYCGRDRTKAMALMEVRGERQQW